ncbi:MAG: pitrilysin family protein [Pseudomonadota bacterium]
MTVRTTTLPSGLRVVTEQIDRVATVSLGVWVGAGARHEPENLSGISHLLEHMAFKGTRRRSAEAIAVEIENVGGHLNAYTGRENTAYYAKVLAEDTDLALDLLADILLQSVFDAEELARERDVVLQEIGQAYDTPDDIIFDHFQATAFPMQPIGRPVLGAPEIVAGMARETLHDYLAQSYTADRMVVAAAGSLDHETIVDRVASVFADVQPIAGQNEFVGASYTGGGYRETRALEQVHLVLGFPGVSIPDTDHYAAALYSTMLGGGMSSRLFQELREKRGMVYSVYSFSSSFTDSGIFGVYAGTGEQQAPDLVPLVFETMSDLGAAPRPGELDRAKAQLRASLLMSMESTGARAEALGQQLLAYGRPLATRELVDLVNGVTEADIARVSERFLSGALTSAAIGPVDTLEDHDRLSERLR